MGAGAVAMKNAGGGRVAQRRGYVRGEFVSKDDTESRLKRDKNLFFFFFFLKVGVISPPPIACGSGDGCSTNPASTNL
jgi:hypothetical protein